MKITFELSRYFKIKTKFITLMYILLHQLHFESSLLQGNARVVSIQPSQGIMSIHGPWCAISIPIAFVIHFE